MYYIRRKDTYSAIIYFKDVLAKYANTPTAYDAALRLVESYKDVKYKDDASEMCTQVRQRYPNDQQALLTLQGNVRTLPHGEGGLGADGGREAATRHQLSADPCGSGSLGGASIPRTTDTSWPPATSSTRCRSIVSCSFPRRRSPSRPGSPRPPRRSDWR